MRRESVRGGSVVTVNSAVVGDGRRTRRRGVAVIMAAIPWCWLSRRMSGSCHAASCAWRRGGAEQDRRFLRFLLMFVCVLIPCV